MAGSYEHVTIEGTGHYAGLGLLENMRDMGQAVHQMWFMIWYLAGEAENYAGKGGDKSRTFIKSASDAYFRCLRGEVPWPTEMDGKPVSGVARVRAQDRPWQPPPDERLDRLERGVLALLDSMLDDRPWDRTATALRLKDVRDELRAVTKGRNG